MRYTLRRISGDSMAPTLHHDQVVLARRKPTYQVGDVVIVYHNGMEKIKRVQQIIAERVFVVGDNQSASTDSRHFGWLASSQITGKVIWPFKLHSSEIGL